MIDYDLERLDLSEATQQKYLQDGPMTKQFLLDPALDERMSKAKNDSTRIKIIYEYIHSQTEHPVLVGTQYIRNNKFKRTAQEVWDDKKMTGCTDYALVFSSIARKYGIPTTMLDTMEDKCLSDVRNNKFRKRISGHVFCECLIDGEWRLVDPTFCITEKKYDPKHLKLTGRHFVGGSKRFTPLRRIIDTGERQDTHSRNMGLVRDALGEWSDGREAKIEKVSREDLEMAGLVPE